MATKNNGQQKEPYLVSVIVPVYGVEQYLNRCIDSIRSQSYGNIEIVCVNDCSPDNSLAILQQQAIGDSRIAIINNETNLGLGASRDVGLEHAHGELVVFVDSDDYLASDYIERFVSAFTDSNLDIIIGGFSRDEMGTIHCRKLMSTDDQAWTYVSACGKLYSTRFLRSNGLSFRGVRYYEDVAFNYRCMLCHPKIKIIDNPGYFYVLNESSITRSGNREKKYLAYIENHEDVAKEYCSKLSGSDREFLEYEFFQSLTIGLLVNVRHTGLKTAKRLYRKRKQTLKRSFPDYLRNKYIGFNKLKSEYDNIRFVLTLYAFAERLHLDKIVVYALSV